MAPGAWNKKIWPLSNTQEKFYWSFYMKQTYETGILGEIAAETYLCGKCGMICLERRYRTKSAEIDLIMQDGDAVVFVEVKTRRTGDPGLGLLAVDQRKQKRIIRASTLYLMFHQKMNAVIRFDVVEVGLQSILHIPNAFQPAGSMFYR